MLPQQTQWQVQRVLSDLTLTPGRLRIITATESWMGPWNEVDIRAKVSEKSCVARMAQDCKFKFLDYFNKTYFLMMVTAWLMIVNLLLTMKLIFWMMCLLH